MTDALTKAIEAGCLALTPENYHSDEANRTYMSVSQYKTFLACPARWTAQYVEQSWQPRQSDALALGTYFHALVLEPETAESVLEAEAEWLLTKGKTPKPTAGTTGIHTMAKRVLVTPDVRKWCEGEHETIHVGTLGGCFWKIKVDTLNLEEGWFSDLKSSASLTREEYISRLGTRGNFIHAYNYGLQLAVYQEILKQATGKTLQPVIVGVSKPTKGSPVPDMRVFRWDEESMLQTILMEVRYGVAAVKKQLAAGERGGRCENLNSDCQYCVVSRTNWIVDIGEEPFNAYRAEG